MNPYLSQPSKAWKVFCWHNHCYTSYGSSNDDDGGGGDGSDSNDDGHNHIDNNDNDAHSHDGVVMII